MPRKKVLTRRRYSLPESLGISSCWVRGKSNVIQPLGQEHIFGAFWAKYCWPSSSRS